jgi:hypothetical protein
MLVHGPVRVPSDARSGDAFIRVELPATSKFRSRPTEIPVTIE